MIRATFADVADNIMVRWNFLRTFFEGLTGFMKGVWESTFGSMLKIVAYFVNQTLGTLGKIGGVLKYVVPGLAAGLKGVVTLSEEAIGSMVNGVANAGAATAGSTSAMTTSLSMINSAMSGGSAESETTTNRDIARRQAEHRRSMSGQRQGQRVEDDKSAGIGRQMDLMGQQQGVDEAIRSSQERLDTAQRELDLLNEQAKTQKGLTESERARAEVAKNRVEYELKAQQEILDLERRKQAIVDKWDPVDTYRRRMQELNELFTEVERGSEVYMKQLKEIEEELASNSWTVEAKFTVSGMEAVRSGTREYLELIQRSQERVERNRVLEQSKKEASRREENANTQAAIEEQERLNSIVVPDIASDGVSTGALGNSDKQLITAMDELATGINRLAENPEPKFTFQSIGISWL